MIQLLREKKYCGKNPLNKLNISYTSGKSKLFYTNGHIPAVPGVHAKLVKQKAAEIEWCFGLLVNGLPLTGCFDTGVFISSAGELLLLLLCLSVNGLHDGTLCLWVHAHGCWSWLCESLLRLRQALRTAVAQLLQKLIQHIHTILNFQLWWASTGMRWGLLWGSGWIASVVVWRLIPSAATVQVRPVESLVKDTAVPRVLPRDVPHDHSHLRRVLFGVCAWERHGIRGNLQVRHECAVVEDKELQVRALEDLWGEFGRLHVGVVMVFVNHAMQ